jgi:hypothetical protein
LGITLKGAIKMTVSEIKKQFIELYGDNGGEIRVFASPGRVNLIGEHIDYCGGHVLPAALTMKTTILARKRNDDIIRLKNKINKDGTLLFVGKTRIDTTNELVVSEETGYKTLRRIVEDAGVTCLAPENCAVYADNRIISFFPREDMSFVPTVSKDLKLSDFLTGETYVSGTPIHIKGALGKAFVIES